MYEGNSFIEMYEDFQREAVNHISRISLVSYKYHWWPGSFKPNPDIYGEWVPDFSEHQYGRRDFWDMCKIKFSPTMKFVRDKRKVGAAVPEGKQKNIQAVLFERESPLPYNVEGQPIHEALQNTQAYTDKTYEVGSSSEHIKTTGSLFGWDFENSIESKTTIGNDTSPAKQEITIGVKWGLHGEKSTGSSDSLGESTTNSTTDHIPIPFGYRTRLTQTQKTGTINIPVTHYMVFDLCFTTELYSGAIRTDFNKRGSEKNARYFSGSPDNIWTHRAKHSRMQALDVRSSQDFKLLMEGRNRRYPRVPKNSFNNWQRALNGKVNIRQAYRWLMRQVNRTSVIHVTDTYKNGFFDYGKLIYEKI